MNALSWVLFCVVLDSFASMMFDLKTTERPELTDEEFLAEMNNCRREVAKMYNVSNMHSLAWSDDLARLIHPSMNIADKFPHTYKTWRFFLVYRYKDTNCKAIHYELERFPQYPLEYQKEKLNPAKRLEMIELEMIHPTQKFLGCGLIKYEPEMSRICFLGPEGDPKLFNLQNISQEAPGSNCDKDYKNDDGLCVPLNPEKISYLGTHEEFIEGVNSIRQEYAVKYNVPNMHSLTWSPELVEVAELINGTDDPEGPGSTWRFAKMTFYKDAKTEIGNGIKDFLEKNKKFPENSTLEKLEFVDPLQKFVGCTMKASNVDNFILCIIGPRSTSSLWNFDKPPTATPGSECSRRYENKDGICVPIGPSAISYNGNPEDFLEDVNLIRQEYSKKFNVPNMHKLTWSENLAKMAGNFEPDGPIRYFEMPTYHEIHGFVEKRFNEFLAKSEEDQKKILEETDQKYLELLVPRQKFIGCAGSGIISCLVGNEETFNLWDFKSKSTPGSECVKRYENKDGLCSPTSEISYFGYPEDFIEDVNSIRQKYAKQYKVANMHLLTWSPELVKTAAQSTGLPETSENGRFLRINLYEGISQRIKKSLKEFLEKDENEQKTYLEKGNASLDNLELLNPLQKFVGCVVKEDPVEDFLFCLVGPRLYFNLWDFKASDNSGLECSKGYKLENDMCTLEGEPSYIGYSDEFLKEVNSHRKMYAKEHNVSNMHELVWSQDLVKIAESLDWSASSWSGSRKLWRWFKYSTYKGAIDLLEIKMNKFAAMSLDEKNEYITNSWESNDYAMELTVPTQKTIGCARKDENTETFVLCLLAPQGEFSMWSFESATLEPKCSSGYEYKDELCTPIDPSRISYFGDPEYFVEDVNSMRRQVAKQYNVPNMHKLVWSEDLAKIAEPLDWNSRWPQMNEAWRFNEILHYQRVDGYIQWWLSDFIAKSEEKRETNIRVVNEENKFTYLEFLVPMQQFIGCSAENPSNNFCLLGYQRTFKLWDFNSTEELGSKCDENYENQDGLCTPIDESTLSYLGTPESFIKELNLVRQKYAKEYNIQNMHELTWSPKLVQDLESFESDSTIRHVKIQSYRGIQEIIEHSVKLRLENDNNVRKLAYSEFLDPLQMFVGCGVKYEKTETFLLCLMGPEISSNLWDFNAKTTPDDTGCPENFESKDGLCSASSENSEILYFGHHEDFLTELNSMRKKYAEKYSTPNMHRLTWLEDLVQIAESFTDDSSGSWRYARIPSYYHENSRIEKEISEFLGKNESERVEHLNRKVLDHLEFLNPVQTGIGCAVKEEKEVLCILGPEEKFQFLDADSKSSNTESCSEGYAVVDGLCTLTTTTTTTTTSRPNKAPGQAPGQQNQKGPEAEAEALKANNPTLDGDLDSSSFSRFNIFLVLFLSVLFSGRI